MPENTISYVYIFVKYGPMMIQDVPYCGEKPGDLVSSLYPYPSTFVEELKNLTLLEVAFRAGEIS